MAGDTRLPRRRPGLVGVCVSRNRREGVIPVPLDHLLAPVHPDKRAHWTCGQFDLLFLRQLHVFFRPAGPNYQDVAFLERHVLLGSYFEEFAQRNGVRGKGRVLDALAQSIGPPV